MRPLLLSILAALSATGCLPEKTEMCMSVDPEAGTCPASEDVDIDDLSSYECDLKARRVIGEGTFYEGWADTGGYGEAASCCYPVQAIDTDPTSECMVVVGRPYLEGERVVAAPLRAGGGWCDESPAGATDPELAACWRKLGQLEHASVAAFARLTLELMAAGAPAALLSAVQAAGVDEVRHAQQCFSVAARLSGEAMSPGPMVFSAPIVPRGDLVSLAVGAAREGCLGETCSAALAAACAERATDPEIRSTLASIAADEARHAALSWQIVAWAIAAGGEAVRAAVAVVLSAPISLGALAPRDGADVEAVGLLGPDASAAVCQRAWAEVIVPARAALLGA